MAGDEEVEHFELDDYLDVSQTMLLTLSAGSHINRAGCELLGRDEADILGSSWFDTFVPSSVRSRMRTRGERLVTWHAAPIRLADGRVAGMILSGLDVTDREHGRKSRERLLKELGDVKFALDQSAIVATTDLGGAITAVNDKFCEISKYSREELLGKDHRVVNSRYHGADFFRNLWSTIAAGRIWHGEIRNRAKDGAIYWVDTTIVPFLDALGRPYQYMAIHYEVTERKAAEARLRQRETLAQLGQMSAMVAHEVKNPLAGISGALQVVGSRLAAESRDRKILDDIEDRIAALNRMLQDLLTFASPRESVPAPNALRTVIGEAAAAIRGDPRHGRHHGRNPGRRPHAATRPGADAHRLSERAAERRAGDGPARGDRGRHRDGARRVRGHRRGSRPRHRACPAREGIRALLLHQEPGGGSGTPHGPAYRRVARRLADGSAARRRRVGADDESAVARGGRTRGLNRPLPDSWVASGGRVSRPLPPQSAELSPPNGRNS